MGEMVDETQQVQRRVYVVHVVIPNDILFPATVVIYIAVFLSVCRHRPLVDINVHPQVDIMSLQDNIDHITFADVSEQGKISSKNQRA